MKNIKETLQCRFSGLSRLWFHKAMDQKKPPKDGFSELKYETRICLTSCKCLLTMPNEFIFLPLTLTYTPLYLSACVYATKLLHPPSRLCRPSPNLSVTSGKMLSIPHSVAAPVTPQARRACAGFLLCKEMPPHKQPHIGHVMWQPQI